MFTLNILKHNLIKVSGLTIILILLFAQNSIYSELKITTGSMEKKLRLIQMLQYASYPVMPPAGTVEFDTTTGKVTMTGTASTTFFGQTLRKILLDTGKIEISLDKSVNGRPVFVGGFNGGIDQNERANGKQSIDVNDLNRLDSTGYSGIGSWVSFLMHELVEQYIGWKYSLTFSQAHDSALVSENEIIFRTGGVRYKREFDIQQNDTIYLIYKREGSNERVILKFPLDQYGQVQEVKRGFINDLKTGHISGGCSGGLCGFSERNTGIIYEPVPGTELMAGAEYLMNDERGNIYGSIPQQEKVIRMNTGGIVDKQYTHSSLMYPAGMAYDPVSEELFVGCGKLNHIVVFDVNGTFKRIVTPARLEMMAGMDIDPIGNLYISSHGNDSIIYMTPFGEVIRRIGNPQLQGPAGLVFADGNDILYAVSNTNNKILMFDNNGAYKGIFAEATTLSSPWGINIAGGKFDRKHPVGLRYTPIERIAVTNAGTNGIIVFNPDGSVKHNLSHSGFQPKALLITRSFSYSLIGINTVSTEMPAMFELKQNYPNPFNPVTKIRFSLKSASSVKLTVFDILGKEVSTIVNDELKAGVYESDFDGAGLSSGIYFYKLTAGGFTETKKMILVK